MPGFCQHPQETLLSAHFIISLHSKRQRLAPIVNRTRTRLIDAGQADVTTAGQASVEVWLNPLLNLPHL